MMSSMCLRMSCTCASARVLFRSQQLQLYSDVEMNVLMSRVGKPARNSLPFGNSMSSMADSPRLQAR